LNLDAATHLAAGVLATMEDECTVNWSSLISAIAPVVLALVLGFVAGKRHYAPPASIFLSAYLSGIRDSSQWLI